MEAMKNDTQLLDCHDDTQALAESGGSSRPFLVESTCFFTDLHTDMTPEEYAKYVLDECGNDSSILVEKMIATVAWHLDRCDGKMNTLEFIQNLWFSISKIVTGIPSSSSLREKYYNDFTRGRCKGGENKLVPANPPLRLPPGMLAVNIHEVGLVGQSCKFGHEGCTSYLANLQPIFTEVMVSTGSGSVLQFASICNRCFDAKFQFNPAQTFDDKASFDTAMSAYAKTTGFNLKKETGGRIKVGEQSLPRYLGASCAKSSRNRTKDCSCYFKISAALIKTTDGSRGGFFYRMNGVNLSHSHQLK